MIWGHVYFCKHPHGSYGFMKHLQIEIKTAILRSSQNQTSAMGAVGLSPMFFREQLRSPENSKDLRPLLILPQEVQVNQT